MYTFPAVLKYKSTIYPLSLLTLNIPINLKLQLSPHRHINSITFSLTQTGCCSMLWWANSEWDPLEKARIGSVQKRMALVIVVGQTVILSAGVGRWNDGSVWPTAGRKKQSDSAIWVDAPLVRLNEPVMWQFACVPKYVSKKVDIGTDNYLCIQFLSICLYYVVPWYLGAITAIFFNHVL